ncbi:MAG TPA: hypothetical protein VGY48_33415 [Vicinamibacterales bacterium]|jgi:hypothetical protein|nr:hypothetical protein [Vicinamibacterales bacterium]
MRRFRTDPIGDANTAMRRLPVAVIAAISLASCASKEPAPIHAHALSRAELTPAEIQYGRAPHRDPSVTYGRDVVIVDGGADIIRERGADGLSWTIDARAPHANEMSVGKIAFVTNQCVGRVLAVERRGPDLRVVLGPAELTDLFERLNVAASGLAVASPDAIERPLPELPGLTWPIDSSGEDGPVRPDVGSLLKAAALEGGDLPLQRSLYRLRTIQNVPPGTPGILPIVPPIRFQTKKPLNHADGEAIELQNANDMKGVRISAQAQLYLRKPTVDFELHINFTRVDARLILHNAAGLKLAFDSAVSDQFRGNINWHGEGPAHSIQLSGNPPLALNIRNDLWVSTVMSARQSVFNAGGEYEFNADLGFTFHDSQFTVVGPKGLIVRRSPMSNMNGVSLGPSGLILRHAVSMTVGVGGLGFTVGPTLGVGTSAGVALGADTGIIKCRGASVALQVQGGVGWTIPSGLAEFVNGFLSILKIRGIPSHGGYSTPWKQVAFSGERMTSGVCR